VITTGDSPGGNGVGTKPHAPTQLSAAKAAEVPHRTIAVIQTNLRDPLGIPVSPFSNFHPLRRRWQPERNRRYTHESPRERLPHREIIAVPFAPDLPRLVLVPT
jgi:hypothetical protein